MLDFTKLVSDKTNMSDFFRKMPKGADIHHHALGALWPEEIWEESAYLHLYVDDYGKLYKDKSEGLCSVLENFNNQDLKNTCFKNWSIEHFDKLNNNPHHHFFDIFEKISPVFIDNEAVWLKRILKKAKEENIDYIETLIEIPSASNKIFEIASSYSFEIDNNSKESDFLDFYQFLLENGLEEAQNDLIFKISEFKKSASELSGVELGFQIYSVRVLDPKDVLAQMILSYSAASLSKHILGVNLVAPEYHPNTLEFYSMQMRACNFLGKLFPKVNLALHAGELTSEIVEEKHLKFHIREAVHETNVKRIGHGVDILSEDDFEELLDAMKTKEIAVEILLESNDFILGIDAKEHPVRKYLKSNIPVILATDDPGILKCTLSDEFYKLYLACPELNYQDFKNLAFNGIMYSFLEDNLKDKLIQNLKSKFEVFELEFFNFE